MPTLPKELSLGSSGGGAIPSSENRLTVGAWSKKKKWGGWGTVGGKEKGWINGFQPLL